MRRNRATALATLVVTLTVLVSLGAAVAASISSDLRRIQPFDGAQGWLNSPPLSPASLRGKIVLVDFWEYTCVNCLKTLPYERAWYDRYRRYGFVIVGVHTPEFRFSGEPANVAAAVRRLGIDWPVAIDSRATVWRRYHNDFWPHEFLVDQAGSIVYDHVGEGDYPDTERQIQGLIKAKASHARLPAVMDYLPQDSYAKPGAVCRVLPAYR
jgi:thiol-disulfide isomerase/thioredoxin